MVYVGFFFCMYVKFYNKKRKVKNRIQPSQGGGGHRVQKPRMIPGSVSS